MEQREFMPGPAWKSLERLKGQPVVITDERTRVRLAFSIDTNCSIRVLRFCLTTWTEMDEKRFL
jgi:hypothetical protein